MARLRGHRRHVPLDADGFERIDAEELLARHRDATVSRGDQVRAIATLTEIVRNLEETVSILCTQVGRREG